MNRVVCNVLSLSQNFETKEKNLYFIVYAKKNKCVTKWDDAGAILDRLLVDLWKAGGRFVDLLEALDWRPSRFKPSND